MIKGVGEFIKNVSNNSIYKWKQKSIVESMRNEKSQRTLTFIHI